jgi:very-short-patch-repair endonuclease
MTDDYGAIARQGASITPLTGTVVSRVPEDIGDVDTADDRDVDAADDRDVDAADDRDDGPGENDDAYPGENCPGENGRDARRAELIAAAQASWVAALTDLGGRNTLLYYKDRRTGTLDLAAADPDALEKFLRTGSIRLTRLFRDVDARADAIRRVQVIYRKARELQEERGIRVAYLAAGLARWDELFLEPAAPVLLRGLTISPTRARHDDFDLLLEDDSEVNPVLLHKLASVFRAATEDLVGAPPEMVGDLLTKAAEAAEVPGFQIADRQVIGTFTYAKLPMVQDLQAAGELLGDSDVVAAIAGDPDAQELLGAEKDNGPSLESPEFDYSVLDADSSQRSAIDTVLAGRSLVIHGPPGTGKSQTIANLIAALVARGRKVLFVAEKRAAIDAVLSRLKGADLGEVVLDIHEGTRDRLRIARDLGDAMDDAQNTADPDVSDLHRRLMDRQRRLARHVSALHQVHQPWGVTPFDVQSALLGIPDAARTQVRLGSPEHIDSERADQIRDELREFAHLGGFTLRPGSTPWFGAALHTTEDARQACELAVRLSGRSLPLFAHRIARGCDETGLATCRSYSEGAARMRLFAAVKTTIRTFSSAIYTADPARLAVAAGDGAGLGFRDRRALRKQARGLVTDGRQLDDAQLATALSEAASQLELWRQLRTDEGMPRLPAQFDDLERLWAECEDQLGGLRAVIGLPAEPEQMLENLAADQDTAWKLPRLYELGRRFDDLGLGPLLDELARRDAAPDLAAAAFDHCWYSSVLDRIRVLDPRYGAHRGGALDEIASDFRVHDVEHLAANRARVRRAWAEALLAACDRHPLQARVIRKQAALRRRHLPLRRLLDQAADVLFAIKPCWAMSPLMVSQVLPVARLFDVVIFDEASQIVPADAIPSIMRGHQIVVAGDDRQLPPTNFFRQVGDSEADADGGDDFDENLVSFGAGFESVLDALRPLLPTAALAWHYRSRDERLVAFSNSRIYGGALTTFPGVLRDDCLRHVVVAQSSRPGQEVSVDAEVDKVVELILQHARTQPEESLGVIALGIKHAERIDAALRAKLAVLADQPSDGRAADLEAFFAEDVAEPFFVKNLERVQGDERDAIILSIGYGKHPDGRMRYQWGPLLRDGGERRLNVAATRAKHRLTLVSSFAPHDVDPERVTKAGARLLADYLEYASSGGSAPEASGVSELDPFEADVRDRLAAAGITVVPQYGVGGYRIDFAATHPEDPSRMVLAIEADGASYRESGSVRDRDRLRGEHLQRLGWRYQRLWSTNWYSDPDAEVAKLRAAYLRAVAESEPAPHSGDAEDAAVRAAGDPAGPGSTDAAEGSGDVGAVGSSAVGSSAVGSSAVGSSVVGSSAAGSRHLPAPAARPVSHGREPIALGPGPEAAPAVSHGREPIALGPGPEAAPAVSHGREPIALGPGPEAAPAVSQGREPIALGPGPEAAPAVSHGREPIALGPSPEPAPGGPGSPLP